MLRTTVHVPSETHALFPPVGRIIDHLGVAAAKVTLAYRLQVSVYPARSLGPRSTWKAFFVSTFEGGEHGSSENVKRAPTCKSDWGRPHCGGNLPRPSLFIYMNASVSHRDGFDQLSL